MILGNSSRIQGIIVISFYLIRSVPLFGFTQDELLIIGLITRYHRKKGPRVKDQDFINLKKSHQELVKILSQLLRIAENLDRSHDGRVKQVRFSHGTEKQVEIMIECSEDYSLEWTAIHEDRGSFKKIFNRELIVKMPHSISKAVPHARSPPIISES